MTQAGITTDDTLVRQVYADQVRAAFGGPPSNVPLTIVPNLVVGLFLVWIMHDHFPPLRVWGWFGLLAVFQLSVPKGMLRRYLKAADDIAAAPYWGNAFAWQAATNGMIWGVAGALFFTPDSPVQLALLCALLCGMSAGAIPVTAMLLPAFYGAVTAMLLPLVARTALTGEAPYLVLSGMVVVYWIYTLNTGHAHNRLFRATFRQTIENARLIGRLVEQTALAEHAREEAVATDRSKSRFLAAASHDLRQPLHAISLFSNALVETSDPAEVRRLGDNLNASVDALSRLLNALLDISKLDAGAVVPRPRAFALEELFERLRNEFGQLAALRGLRLRVRPTAAVADTDPLLLEQVLRNLMSNALRYTERGSVLVACRRRGDGWRIEVRDSGIGIDEHEHEKIFGEYYQIGNPERDRRKGLGLGLAIVDRVSRLIGCPVGVRSAPGRGSVFALNVPAGALAPKEAMQPQPAQLSLAGMRVLVVDDETDVLAATCAQLRSWKCDAMAAESLDQAVERMEARAWVPDGVISDLRLRGGRDGIEVLDRLRQRYGERLHCVLVTGDTATGQLQVVRQSGYTVLHKPVRPARLRALLGQWAADAADDDTLAA